MANEDDKLANEKKMTVEEKLYRRKYLEQMKMTRKQVLKYGITPGTDFAANYKRDKGQGVF